MLNLEPLYQDFQPWETDRLRVRPVALDDAVRMFAILSDPVAVQHFGIEPFETLEQAVDRCRAMIEGFADHSQFRLALELKASGEFIGTAGIWRWVLPHHRAELGYEISRDHWGHGYVVEALRPILAHAFAHGLHAVEANIVPENEGSRRVLQKLGFKEEGYQREWYYERGVFADNAVFGLRADEFLDTKG